MVKFVEQYSILDRAYGIEKIDDKTYASWSNGCLVEKSPTLHAAREFLLAYAKVDLANKASELDVKARRVEEALATLDQDEHSLAKNVALAKARPDSEVARIVYDALLDAGFAFTVAGGNGDPLHKFHLWNPNVYVRCMEDSEAMGVPHIAPYEGIFIRGLSAARQFYLMLNGGPNHG